MKKNQVESKISNEDWLRNEEIVNKEGKTKEEETVCKEAHIYTGSRPNIFNLE